MVTGTLEERDTSKLWENGRWFMWANWHTATITMMLIADGWPEPLHNAANMRITETLFQHQSDDGVHQPFRLIGPAVPSSYHGPIAADPYVIDPDNVHHLANALHVLFGGGEKSPQSYDAPGIGNRFGVLRRDLACLHSGQSASETLGVERTLSFRTAQRCMREEDWF